MTHFLALATTRGRFGFGFLAVMFPVAGIHIAFDIGGVFNDVGHHTFLQGPAEEVELTDSGLLNGWLTAHLKTDALTTAEGIKQSLGVRLEFAFVVKVHQKLTGRHIWCLDQWVCHVELFGVVRDKPVDQTQTYR